MANQQPFYHRVTVLFTANQPMSREEVMVFIRRALRSTEIVVEDSIECEDYSDPEPGDPADLM